MIWLNLLLFAVAFIGLSLLTPKPKTEKLRPQELDDINFPRATDGAPIPLVLGTVRMRGPNTLWYGDFESKANKKKVKTGILTSETVTTGFSYYLGVDLGLCLGANDVKLLRMWIDKDQVWPSLTDEQKEDGDLVRGDVGPATESFQIDEPKLFGGKDSGGGFTGTARFYGGSFSQAVNAYVDGIEATIPAYRGLCHLVLEKPYIGNSAQLRPMSFELQRLPNPLSLAAEVNVIGDDLNPVSALYFILIDAWSGLGIDPGDIDTASFTAAAATVAAEDNGISLIISSPNSAIDAIREIQRQIDATIYQDPETGDLVLKLIRDDYAVGSLPVYDETNIITIRNFTQTLWTETANEIRVTYNDRASNYKQATALAQNMANINAQGRLRSSTVSFPGVAEADLASALAARELAQAGVPLFRATIELNREGHELRPGDVFVLSWDDYNIAEAVMRVQRLNLGELVDGRIVLEAIQDTFAAATVVFASTPGTLHTPVVRSPVEIPAASRLWQELPYFLAEQQTVVDTVPADHALTLALARSPGGAQQGYSVYMDDDSGFGDPSADVDRQSYPSTALLETAITATDGKDDGEITVTIELIVTDEEAIADFLATASDSAARNGDSLFFINDELFAYTTVTDNMDGTYDLLARRALLDTEFAAHSEGDVVFFLTSGDGIGLSAWPDTDTIYAQWASFTDRGEYDYSGDTADQLDLDERYDRPLPPDRPTLGGSVTPGTIITTGPHTIAWRERSRLDAAIAWEDDATDTPEGGQTYRVEFWLDASEEVGKRQVGVSGASTPITFDSPTSGAGEIRIYAERDSLLSRTPSRIFMTMNIA